MRVIKAKEKNIGIPTSIPRSEPRRKKRKVIYPESDGKPMADNTKQFEWIVKIKENLERIYADNPNVFVAGDLLWYPIEGDNKTRIAPDVMVVFGRPKGHRGSYRTFDEDNISPQVVFEILSPGNRKKEMDEKFQFYEDHGVQEYYVYDPDHIQLNGWIRSGEKLCPIENMQGWVSPLLNIRFEPKKDDLTIVGPDGEEFLTPLEKALRDKARIQEEAKRAEAERKRAEAEQKRTEAERKRAEAERKRAEAEQKRAEAERKRAEIAEAKIHAEAERAEAAQREKERLAAKLRELGFDPNQL